MVSTPSPPKAPDPQATASAQTSTNLATAQANAAMNNINQVTPYGNLTYSQTGQNFIADPNGQQYYVDSSGQYHSSLPTHDVTTAGTAGHYETQRVSGGHGDSYDNQVWVPGTSGSTSTQTYTPDGWTSTKGYYVPTYTATQTLNPTQQATLDQTQQANLNLGTLANQQSAKMIDYLNTPLDLSSANVDKYINDNWQGQFNNQWDRSQASLQQQLADQGVKLGSEAYSNAMRDYTTQRQSASDQYTGDMYNNAMNAILTQRNQPINEISALLSGSQVTKPTYASSTASSTIPTVDYAGIVNQGYQNQMAGYNTQLQQSNAAMGGLFGLGSSLLGGWAMSDRRLKTNIQEIGTMANGLKLYAFDYVWGEPSAGFMADEVADLMPEAVSEGPGGFLMVDYARAA
ncbi:tail fiber domain-containing protein [Agrobacterium rhizogenes]|nr:tail fiber domain-containing protein [Rhizobium rhizogenes]NTJ83598.1 tail fiber domain-containing protein [Rhizobium rhizogenes]